MRTNVSAAKNNATCNYQVENVIDTGIPSYSFRDDAFSNGCFFSTDVPSVMRTGAGPFYSQMTSYLQVPTTQHYQLLLESTYVGFILRINGNQIVNSFLQQPKNKAQVSIILQRDNIHTIAVEFFSTLNGNRSFTLQWKDDSSNVYEDVSSLFYNYKSM